MFKCINELDNLVRSVMTVSKYPSTGFRAIPIAPNWPSRTVKQLIVGVLEAAHARMKPPQVAP